MYQDCVGFHVLKKLSSSYMSMPYLLVRFCRFLFHSFVNFTWCFKRCIVRYRDNIFSKWSEARCFVLVIFTLYPCWRQFEMCGLRFWSVFVLWFLLQDTHGRCCQTKLQEKEGGRQFGRRKNTRLYTRFMQIGSPQFHIKSIMRHNAANQPCGFLRRLN